MDYTSQYSSGISNGRTADSFVQCNTYHELSNGAAADYGFDNFIYILNENESPTPEQLETLWKKYHEIIKKMGKETFANYLHKNINNLPSILGEGFEWVLGSNSS